MTILYVVAILAAMPVALRAWNEGARWRRRAARGIPLAVLALAAGCNAGGLLEVDDAGAGGGATTSSSSTGEVDAGADAPDGGPCVAVSDEHACGCCWSGKADAIVCPPGVIPPPPTVVITVPVCV